MTNTEKECIMPFLQKTDDNMVYILYKVREKRGDNLFGALYREYPHGSTPFVQ